MFTGLVEAVVEVSAVRDFPPGRELELRFAPQDPIRVGESIAVNGCCLTVAEIRGDCLKFEAGPETLVRTNLGELVAGSQVNVERALRAGDRLGGHFVTGHIDAVGIVDDWRPSGEWVDAWFRAPRDVMRHVASKGSVAIDGVSLTVVDVEPERFSAMLIPHTLAQTTLGSYGPGRRVNLESDLLAKYVLKHEQAAFR